MAIWSNLSLKRKIFVMKINTHFIAGLLAMGLLTVGAEGAFAGHPVGVFGGRTVGGYFSAGNPGGLRYRSGYPIAQTPANQAWERNNAWAAYNAQLRQTPGTNISTGKPR
jgi:hypothetical protein